MCSHRGSAHSFRMPRTSPPRFDWRLAEHTANRDHQNVRQQMPRLPPNARVRNLTDLSQQSIQHHAIPLSLPHKNSWKKGNPERVVMTPIPGRNLNSQLLPRLSARMPWLLGPLGGCAEIALLTLHGSEIETHSSSDMLSLVGDSRPIELNMRPTISPEFSGITHLNQAVTSIGCDTCPRSVAGNTASSRFESGLDGR